MSFVDWLNNRYASRTVERYLNLVNAWIAEVGAARAEAAVYLDLSNWIGQVRERTPNTTTVQMHVFALRAYYTWLIETGVRTDDPTSALVLSGQRSRRVHLPLLLVPQEVRRLRLHAAKLSLSECVILDLLVWSALRSREIVLLTLQDVDLTRGVLCVPATGRGDARTIVLGDDQQVHLDNYLRHERPQLAQRETDLLVLTRRGNSERVDGIKRMIRRLRWLVPGRHLTPTLIRQSVLSMMLNAGQDLRAVQIFAGHRYPGSTERYRFTGLEELRAAVTKLHPME